MTPRALDLFCCAGGATRGLQLAGFHVTGVDINPQPHYCGDAFHQADALTFPLDGFDFIWASPPCQRHTSLKVMWNAHEHLDLIPDTRKRLSSSNTLYVIENVVGAPLIAPVQLCGTAFNLGVSVDGIWRELRRHRLFEANFKLTPPACTHHGLTIGIYGDHARDRRRKPGVRDRGIDFPDCNKIKLAQTALGIDWCPAWKPLSQAIPPAYARFIGEQAIQLL